MPSTRHPKSLTALDAMPGPSAHVVEEQLRRILSSPEFRATDRMRDFLRFVVEETLAGRAHEVKEHTIATKVYGRQEDFNPAEDPTIRIQAGRLRQALERFYLGEGVRDPVRIHIPKRTFVPTFQARLKGKRGGPAPLTERETFPILLIRTKLHRPPVAEEHLTRPQLMQRLERNRQRPLTLVSAPAGYGKTTLVSCWLESCDLPSAWVSLDEYDNDLHLFLSYFLAAVQTVFPDACRGTQDMLSASDMPPMPVLARSLINELDRVDQSFALVLDDYHVIHEKSAHDLISELLRHPPQPLHLVLVTRRDPPLPLTSLRARGQMTEIRVQQLRFSRAETTAFLENVLDTSVDDTAAAVLEKKTEGWVTGLRLAALSMRHRDGLDPKLLEPHVEAQYVMEYLFTEVLSRQPPEIGQYLLSTAILDRFCSPLCEAVCAPGAEPFTCEIGGWDFIAWLKKGNMFLVPLDAENRWFRFHHLFQKLLLNQLNRRFSSKDIAMLHSRASAWFAENGLIDEAIRHALAAGDEIGAAQLVEQHRQAMLNSDRWYVLEKWLSMLPDTVILQRPELLLAQAWIHYFYYKYEAMPAILDLVESLLNNQPQEQPLYGEIYLFKGIFCFFQGDGELSLKYIEDALDRIPEDYPMIRGFAEVWFGLAGQMQGQGKRVEQVLSDLLRHQSLHDLRKVRVIAALAVINYISGDLTIASEMNQQLRNFTIRINALSYLPWSLYLQGVFHFHRNKLDMAIDHFSQAADLLHLLVRRGSVDCLAGLALAYQAMQQKDKATATLERLFEYIHSLDDPSLLKVAHSSAARISLMKGEVPFLSGAPGINQKSDAEAMVFWLEIPAITQCRVLIAQGSDASLQEAENKLQECLQLSQAQHNTFQMIGIMVLQALALQKQGRTDDALAVLEKTVDLAKPGGWIRPFVESGPTMEGLLKRLAEKNVALDYIGKLLAAFSPTTHPPPSSEQLLEEHLTNRELDIIDLLTQRLQTKEIAEKLSISTETVNTHLKRIYRKLDVHNRRQAVKKAQAIGVLSHG